MEYWVMRRGLVNLLRHSRGFWTPIGILGWVYWKMWGLRSLGDIGVSDVYSIKFQGSIGQGSGVYLGLRNEVCGMLGYAERPGVERSQAWLGRGV